MSEMTKLWKLVSPWLRVLVCIGLLMFLFYQTDAQALFLLGAVAAFFILFRKNVFSGPGVILTSCK